MDPAVRVQVAQREHDAAAVEPRVLLGLLARGIEQHAQVAATAQLHQKVAELLLLEGVEEAHDRGVVEAGLRLLLLEQVLDALLLLRRLALAALLERVLVPGGSKAVGSRLPWLISGAAGL